MPGFGQPEQALCTPDSTEDRVHRQSLAERTATDRSQRRFALSNAPEARPSSSTVRCGRAAPHSRGLGADDLTVSAESWSIAASVSGAACVSLALVVVVAGWRRRIVEVAILGAALLSVSVFATSHGLGTTPLIGGGPPGMRWAGTLALPAGALVALPLLVPTTRFGRWCAHRAAMWVVGWSIAMFTAATLLVFVNSTPPPAILAAAVVSGTTGAALLVRRQRLLYRISRRQPALITAIAISAIAFSSAAGLLTTPGGAASWGVLVTENVGVMGAGVAALLGYRSGRSVADILAPILSREPLAALELGLSPEIHEFVLALDRKDRISRDHVVRTSALAMRVAIRAGLAPERVRAVAVGALLHDIGKLVIPSDIINKPGALTDEEFATIKTHPEQGERLLAGAPSLVAASPHVRGHHERVDGRGYPDGLAGDEVVFEVGLVSVVDAWDAMTHTRQYREGMGPERAAAILRNGAGSQWRIDAVDLLLAEVSANGQVDLEVLAAMRDRQPEVGDEVIECVCEDVLGGIEAPSTSQFQPAR